MNERERLALLVRQCFWDDVRWYLKLTVMLCVLGLEVYAIFKLVGATWL